ncbi:hypothetical protein DM01DRAFT_1283137 [Hesseltinella vesiculosa]|uniref:HSF-type DNA-binding domain-containing protein n=1 Tax=Hesseltinella vesiculosa TaxID=101127 RepID=A0A1X2GQ47_9FUNG|nr:hypothetical protein DM01DRAFT_1283137 [Hesseltinella vesiculosa]
MGSPASIPSVTKPNTNTFVHKLYNMVLDDQYQHLIAWSYSGSSFIVCNILDFSKDVLPKHFKHNNFSSFVRQLNMYGFHKVNKSPRGHRTLAENQIWEFSHAKFLRDRQDLLEEIKRKTMDADQGKTNHDFHTQLTLLQMAQSDMMQQIQRLFDQFQQVVQEVDQTKKKHQQQSLLVDQLMNHITQQNGGNVKQKEGNRKKKLTSFFWLGQLPPELAQQVYRDRYQKGDTPSIFVTSHENTLHSPSIPSTTLVPPPISISSQQLPPGYASPSYPSSPLTVRTQNLFPTSPSYIGHSLSPMSANYPTSLASTPTTLMPSDDDISLYSPRTPTELTHQPASNPTIDDLLHHGK